MFTKKFWVDTAERVLATAAEAALGVLAAGSVVDLSTKPGLIVVATASAAAFLKSLVGAKVTDDSVSPASLVSAD